MRLTNDDRCAVDLILERSSESHSQGCFSRAPSATLEERLGRVEKILHILDSLPAEDPPADLVSRTVDRCEHAVEHRPLVEHPVHATSSSAR